MGKTESNYEIMKKQMQAKFASYDMETVAKEWELRQKDGYLYLEFVCNTSTVPVFSSLPILFQEFIWQLPAVLPAECFGNMYNFLTKRIRN